MSCETSLSALQTDPGSLRRRAEARLRKELSIKADSQQHEVGRQLYELRISQIEIELLGEEFNKLRRQVFTDRADDLRHRHSKYGYFFIDSEARIIDARFIARHPEGSNTHRWMGQSLYDSIAPGQRDVFRQFLRELVQSNEKRSFELTFDQACGKRHLGLKLPLYASIEAVADSRKSRCLLVIEDVTERRQSEEREKSSRAALDMLNQTISASRNEILMFDVPRRHFTFANPRALENLGYSIDELQLLAPDDIQESTFKDEMEDRLDQLLRQKKSVQRLNSIFRRKDGSLYPVEVFLQLFEQETGDYFIAIVLDISCQTAIESQLKSIVESADAIIWAANTELKLVFISNQVLDILGHNAARFLGYSLPDMLSEGFFHEADHVRLSEGIRQVVKEGCKVADLRCRAKHADGTWRWLSINMTPNRSVDGRVGQVVGVMHDIHAQKLIEDALLKLNQELDSRVQEEVRKNKEKDLLLQRQSRLAGMGEMIGNIAHQWRQPINSLGLILADLEDAAEYGECDLAYIRSAVEKSKKIIRKMSGTIDDFRHFFRADKSQREFSLRLVTDECINLVEASMKSNNINIVVRCDRDVAVFGYANEYSQAVMNILVNAKEAIVGHNNHAGEIVIEIGEEGDYGLHRITDNGGGILPDVLPKIFEPHFTTKEFGVGIGLYMTLTSIEKNMHGRITVENVADGACFSIYLPKARNGEHHAIH